MFCYIFFLIKYHKISPNVSSNWYRVLQPKKSRRHKLSWQPEAFSYDLIIQNSLFLLHLKYKCVIRVTVVCMPSKCSGYYIFNSLCFTFMLTIGLFFLWACLEIFCKVTKSRSDPIAYYIWSRWKMTWNVRKVILIQHDECHIYITCIFRIICWNFVLCIVYIWYF